MITPSGVTHEEIDIRFGFHTAKGRPDVAERHDYVRWLCRELAHQLVDHLPEGRDKSLALTALEDVMMRGNRAIALHYRDVPPTPPPIPRPIPRPPASSAYQASRPQPVYRSQSSRGPSVPKPRPPADDKDGGAST